MSHPEIEAAGEVVDLSAFRQVYAPRGWQLMDPATEFANNQLGRFVRSADDLTKNEARALIATNGGDYPDEEATTNEVLASYRGMFGDKAPRPAVATESPTGVPIELYDPSAHTAAEVTEHLQAADEDERFRVLQAEESGKNRKTVTEWVPVDDSAPADNENQE
jgi:hypothetical protein